MVDTHQVLDDYIEWSFKQPRLKKTLQKAMEYYLDTGLMPTDEMYKEWYDESEDDGNVIREDS